MTTAEANRMVGLDPRYRGRDSKVPLSAKTAMIVTMAASFLCGCGASHLAENAQQGISLAGRVHGGQQPVSNASIYLYAAGSTGNGIGAVNLLLPHVVTTDANGFFSLTGDYQCPTPATQVYLLALGGNPGLTSGTNNPALAMMAALGNCGALTASTYSYVNEVTTVASVWALSQFLGAGGVVGSTGTNATGLQNAFAIANNLADMSTGIAPGSALPPDSLIETAKLYTLANILAPCINSDGGSGCGALFAAATVAGSVPANTIDAALNIVRNPAANVRAVYQAGPTQGPYPSGLPTQPNDWTMSLTYGNCAAACDGLNLPGAIAIDGAGDAWIANYFGAAVSAFAPTGVPLSPTGFAGTGLRQSYGIAIDGLNNVWVTNEQSVTAANNSHHGSVSKFSPAGVELSASGYTGGGVYYPHALAADPTGRIWVADYASSSASLLANDGTPLSGSGFATSQLPFTSAVALDAAGNAWYTFQGGAARVTPAGIVNSFSCCANPEGIAIDQSGNLWIADYNASGVIELSSSGTVANTVTLSGGNVGPKGIAVDGAGNIWVANYYGDTFAQLAGTTAAVLSPPLGYGLDSTLNEPYGLAIDASGNLWFSNAGSNTVTQIIGLASPIRTPLLGPPSQP